MRNAGVDIFVLKWRPVFI